MNAYNEYFYEHNNGNFSFSLFWIKEAKVTRILRILWFKFVFGFVCIFKVNIKKLPRWYSIQKNEKWR